MFSCLGSIKKPKGRPPKKLREENKVKFSSRKTYLCPAEAARMNEHGKNRQTFGLGKKSKFFLKKGKKSLCNLTLRRRKNFHCSRGNFFFFSAERGEEKTLPCCALPISLQTRYNMYGGERGGQIQKLWLGLET